ncbi:hypothetical protein [Oryza sativa Japonica Group]|uniref:DUF7912 domain-containing protein n=2 Tax=Oryza sativa subsp. japonica TaxID=39947 RepID=Q7F5B8_ORYSJ|nr:hypothetical protein [Oryza sativa Japonica Group]BAB92312.1 hypothetical protein [Oryza sativa Japonica Group]
MRRWRKEANRRKFLPPSTPLNPPVGSCRRRWIRLREAANATGSTQRKPTLSLAVGGGRHRRSRWGRTTPLSQAVSSPGAERLLEVPEDLDRFKDMAIRVQYLVEGDDLVLKQILRKNGIFLLKSVDIQAEHCIRKLGRCQGEPSCSWERKVIEQETKGLEAANFV